MVTMASPMKRARRLEIDPATLTDRHAVFVAEPLERGLGLVLGNGLRRVLLSSIRGASITQVRFDGALHEFASLDGVVEDAIDIVQNLKGVVIAASSAGPHYVVASREAPGTLRAGDLVVPAALRIVNPDHPIATLDHGGRLRMDLTVTTGRGYLPADRPRDVSVPIGAIPVDGLFSPIRRVTYAITEARVGGSTEYERLTLDVLTNGAIGPEEAVAIAATILRHQLTPFETSGEPLVPEPVIEETPALNEHLLLPLDELTLSVRAANCMESARIELIGDLVQKTDHDILRIRNMGRITLREIENTLRDMGLSLGMHVPNWPEVRAAHLASSARRGRAP